MSGRFSSQCRTWGCLSQGQGPLTAVLLDAGEAGLPPYLLSDAHGLAIPLALSEGPGKEVHFKYSSQSLVPVEASGYP